MAQQWKILALLLLLRAVPSGTQETHETHPSITIIQPLDASRLWVDDEHPAVVEVVVVGVEMPKEGHVKLFMNGR